MESGDLDFRAVASRCLFEGDLEIVTQVRSPLCATPARAACPEEVTKEVSEDIFQATEVSRVPCAVRR